MIRWLQISSGRGPAECEWVVAKLVDYMMNRAVQRGLKLHLIEAVSGGIPRTLRSALMAVEGESGVRAFADNWNGTVQWIGQSMFRPRHRRKNWFVSVKTIVPVKASQMCARDIRVDRMRSSGPGGQHANKTESAIRVTHVPTGLCAVSQEERSQRLNKKLAMARLHRMVRHQQDQARRGVEKKRWEQHNCLERGNAVHVFKGVNFKRQK